MGEEDERVEDLDPAAKRFLVRHRYRVTEKVPRIRRYGALFLSSYRNSVALGATAYLHTEPDDAGDAGEP